MLTTFYGIFAGRRKYEKEVVERLIQEQAYIPSILLNIPQLYPTFIQFCKFGSIMPYISSILLNSAQYTLHYLNYPLQFLISAQLSSIVP